MVDFGEDWSQYARSDLSLRDFLGNLHTHTDLFEEVAVHAGEGRILEVGIGTGSMSTFLSWLGYRVTGIDNSPDVLDNARRTAQALHARDLQFVEADAFELPFADDSFDVAFHQGLLEHFADEDIHRLLGEQLRVAPVVVTSMPNDNYPQRDFGDERLLASSEWEEILSPYRQIASRSYFEQAAGRFRRPRPIMYVAVIARNSRAPAGTTRAPRAAGPG